MVGFIAILLLMSISVLVSIVSLNNANQSLSSVTEYNIQKIQLAHRMHDVVRERQVVLFQMLATLDPFERDEQYLTFSALELDYMQAREKLLALPKNSYELSLHDELTQQVRKTRNVNRSASEMLANDIERRADIVPAINQAMAEQTILINKLQSFIKLQNKYAQQAEQAGQNDFQLASTLAVFIALIIATVSGLIAYIISSFVSRKNQELVETNHELALATASKSEFVANMSHEIRTPLTSIIGFAETMKDKNQPLAERKTAVSTIISSGKHLLQIINDLLDLSKIEATKLIYENIHYSTFTLLHEIESVIKPQAIEKGVNFNINYAFPVPKEIHVDPLRARQVLLNLCSNALKFTSKGHVYITVSYRNDSNQISFDVTDTGIGMSEEVQSKIFLPFEQAETSTTRNFGGTGLGLSLSKQLADGMGGTLSVTSKEGVGSRFTLKFPVNIASPTFIHSQDQMDEKPQELESEQKLVLADRYTGDVLLAEDNKNNQKLMQIYFDRFGLDIDIANNGLEAVQKAKQKRYDVIFMDMRMPEMDGITATREIRSFDTIIPIIALTANVMRDDQQTFFDAGCTGFLAKPVDLNLFCAAISEHLEPADTENDNELEPLVSSLADSYDLDELIEEFVEELPEKLEQAIETYDGKDYVTLKDLIHDLKGSTGNYGFMEVSTLLAEMESQLKDNPATLAPSFEKLNRLIQRILLGIKNKGKLSSSDAADTQPRPN